MDTQNTTTTNTPLRDAWLAAEKAFDDIDCDAGAYPTDEEYDALEQAAATAKARFPASDEPHLYALHDDSGATTEVSANLMTEALRKAEEWVRTIDWIDSGQPSTVFLTVTVRDLATSEEDQTTVTIEPDEPECIDGAEHDWQAPYGIVGGIEQNPGVWGHGGGVRIKTVCMRCGCGRLINAWAENPSNGEQGLTAVSYSPGEYKGELAVS